MPVSIEHKVFLVAHLRPTDYGCTFQAMIEMDSWWKIGRMNTLDNKDNVCSDLFQLQFDRVLNFGRRFRVPVFTAPRHK